MNTLLTAGTRSIVGALAALGLVGPGLAQGGVTTEKIHFELADAFEPGAAVSGELRMPESKRERLPVVVILHSSPGFDGRGAFYAEALNRAGIATVEIDYLRGKGLPATPRHNLPHAYETLQHLARHPRIDAARIGIMGFSWGGLIAVLTSSDALTRQYTGGQLRFAAHLGVYPICWIHRAVLGGTSKYDFKPVVYQRVTGQPIHVLVGDKDDSDGPDACRRFEAELPARVRPHFSLTVNPGATFGWDSRFGSATYLPGANQGKGGIVTVVADPETASRSRRFAVEFFSRNLGAP